MSSPPPQTSTSTTDPLTHSVIQHYQQGTLLTRILTTLHDTGIDPSSLTPSHLHSVDQFHIGGLKALTSLLTHLSIQPNDRVLDLGCGLGGTCRVIAEEYPGVSVVGIDITPEFIEVSNELTTLVKMDNKIRYVMGSATRVPFEDMSFDVVVMVYVGMNIEDKNALFSEAYRVLAPGGVFAIKDAVLEENKTSDDLIYPVPWATEPGQSFASHSQVYIDAAAAAGFELVQSIHKREEGIAFAKGVPPSGPPPLSLPRVTFGDNGMTKMKNIVHLIKSETITPCEMIFKKSL